MKRKTWIISALMYAAVFAACIGVLYVMKEVMKPQGQETVAESGDNASGGDAGDAGVLPSGAGSALDGSVSGAGNNGSEAGNGENQGDGTGNNENGESEDQLVDIKRENGYNGWKKKLPSIWQMPAGEEIPYTPPRIIIATDLHYQSAASEDDGEAFKAFVEHGDGKVVRYLPELLEAFIDQVIEEKPSALVLSGDITMNGEKVGHEELAERLARVREAGIPVLVIPGNHDINNPNASEYFEKEKKSAPSVTAEEFYRIYHEYGYDNAMERDDVSLSYVYKLDEKNWLLMLDSCQYEPSNRVEGRIREETLAWADRVLEKAKEEGVFVLPIAHHNLLSQSRMYTIQCVMENSSEIVGLFEKYQLPLYLSGHLHVQRIRKYKSEPGVADDAYGIQEIITDALSIPPCQYGLLSWEEDGSLEYETKFVDVSAWARKNQIDDANLLDFEDWSFRYLKKLISDQIRGVIKNLGDDVESSMASVYAAVYMDYYAGRKIDVKGVKTSEGYRWWERNLPDSYLMRELNSMLADSDRDNNYLLLPEAAARTDGE